MRGMQPTCEDRHYEHDPKTPHGLIIAILDLSKIIQVRFIEK